MADPFPQCWIRRVIVGHIGVPVLLDVFDQLLIPMIPERGVLRKARAIAGRVKGEPEELECYQAVGLEFVFLEIRPLAVDPAAECNVGFVVEGHEGVLVVVGIFGEVVEVLLP